MVVQPSHRIIHPVVHQRRPPLVLIDAAVDQPRRLDNLILLGSRLRGVGRRILRPHRQLPLPTGQLTDLLGQPSLPLASVAVAALQSHPQAPQRRGPPHPPRCIRRQNHVNAIPGFDQRTPGGLLLDRRHVELVPSQRIDRRQHRRLGGGQGIDVVAAVFNPILTDLAGPVGQIRLGLGVSLDALPVPRTAVGRPRRQFAGATNQLSLPGDRLVEPQTQPL